MIPMENPDKNRPGQSKQWKNTIIMCIQIAIPLAIYLFFFQARSNFRQVVPQKVYRSAQPTQSQLKDWVDRYKIKTVINLRGNEDKIVAEERAFLDGLGVTMTNLRLSSSRLPARFILLDLIDMIEKAEPPVLIHCRSGIDRAGTASALAAMAIGNADYENARWHAYVPPGPWKRKKYKRRLYFHYYLHISDIFKFYENYCRTNNLDVDNWQQFKNWVKITDKLPEVEPK